MVTRNPFESQTKLRTRRFRLLKLLGGTLNEELKKKNRKKVR